MKTLGEVLGFPGEPVLLQGVFFFLNNLTISFHLFSCMICFSLSTVKTQVFVWSSSPAFFKKQYFFFIGMFHSAEDRGVLST